ncbi:hypothetical protein ACFSY7_15500 [Kurthia populi]|uniref:Uncharacterized protein n=1 Tax=Kurthia populi TaxID=1562132 RepID=A0ABW5Y436_9BACL
MKLLLVNDIDTLKSTDNATQVELAVLDEEQQRIDLSQFTTIAVQIGSNGSLYSTETPIINEEMNIFSFTLSSELPAGTYSIQVNLTTADNKLHIAPNAGTQRLLIEKSFNEVGETIPIISIKSLLDDMAETLVIAKDAKTVADEAKTHVTQAVEASENAVSQVESAVANANQAVQSSTDAVAVANEAKNVAQTATAASSEAMTQADGAKALSTQATNDATKAKTDASNALSTANSAKSTAESVEIRFNELTEGNTNDEVIQSRTDEENVQHDTLKARIDSEATKRAIGDASALQSAKDYTDGKVGNIDLSALSTKEETATAVQSAKDYADMKDVDTLQSARDYTNAEISKIPPVDLSGYSTTEQVEAKDAEILQQAKQYTDNHVPVIDTSGFATKESVADVSNNLVLHQADLVTHGVYGVASGTNALTMTISNVSAYVEGMLVAFKNTTESNGATTLNINNLGAKAIVKANGTAVNNLKANAIYQVRYNGVNFILQGEGGSGNAIASDLLSGKTASTDAGDIVGTIPSKTTQTYTPGTTNQIITSGQYLSGTQTILGDPDLISANILSGKNIFGVVGSLVQGKRWASGTATSSSGSSSVGTSNGTESMSTLSVNGLSLPFTPSIIIAIESTGVSYPAIYNSKPLINWSTENYYLYSKNFIKSPYFTVNSGGFSLPVSTGDKVYQWIAIE